MDYQVLALREIGEKLGASPLRQMALEPGVMAIYRVTDYYAGESCNSVATLRHTKTKGAQLTVKYVAALGGKPLIHSIPAERYEAFAVALQKARFDHLRDHDDLPLYGADWWMVERAAGSFVRSIIIAPQRAEGNHAAIVAATRSHLPEALREVPSR